MKQETKQAFKELAVTMAGIAAFIGVITLALWFKMDMGDT